MVCASEVYQWFKTLSPHNRIELTCGLLQLCLPNELTFIGTLIEDMSNKDFEVEEKCNSPTELLQYSQAPLNIEHVHKLCLTLSLLKPSNQMLAHIIYEILTIHFSYLCQNVMIHNDFSNDIMLLFALASYHPAFTFQYRLKLGECFATLIEIFNEDYKESPNNNNSALVNDHIQLKMSVNDVFIERTNALIIIEISSQHLSHKYVTKRQCHYSQIKEFISKTFDADHEFYTTITKLCCNGSFIPRNIRNIVNKIIDYSYSHSFSEEAKKIGTFFFYLPIWNYLQKDKSEVDYTPVSHDITPYINKDLVHEFYFNKNKVSNSNIDVIEKQKKIHDDRSDKSGSVNILEETTNNYTSSIQISKTERKDNVSETKSDKNVESYFVDKGIVTKNIYPFNIFNLPCQPYLNYYFPNYSCYSNTDCCTSSISGYSSSNTQESTIITPVTGGINSTNRTVMHQCNHSTLIPYNIHQSTFTPIHLIYSPINYSFHLNEPFPTIISNVSSSLSLSNVISRSHTTTIPFDKLNIAQNIPHHYRDTSL